MRQEGIFESEQLHLEMRTHMFAMRNAGSHEAVVKHWVAVISAYVRIFNKLRAASKGHQPSWTFTNRLANQVRTDPLLAYAKAARGAEEHGIGVGHAQKETIGPISHPANSPLQQLADEEGLQLWCWPVSSFLIPVINEGRWYHPPSRSSNTTTVNLNEDPSTPINVALQLCLKVHRWLEEAKTLAAHT